MEGETNMVSARTLAWLAYRDKIEGGSEPAGGKEHGWSYKVRDSHEFK